MYVQMHEQHIGVGTYVCSTHKAATTSHVLTCARQFSKSVCTYVCASARPRIPIGYMRGVHMHGVHTHSRSPMGDAAARQALEGGQAAHMGHVRTRPHRHHTAPHRTHTTPHHTTLRAGRPAHTCQVGPQLLHKLVNVQLATAILVSLLHTPQTIRPQTIRPEATSARAPAACATVLR